MEYDRGDSFPFDFEPNAIPFDANGIDQIQFNPKGNGNLFS